MTNGSFRPNRCCECERCARGRMIGGVVLLTLGALFLLSEFTRFGFHSTWPVLLIVGGIVMVWVNAASREGHLSPSSLLPTAPPPPQPPPPTPGSDSSQVPHV